jgi:hypothetical protein
VIPAAPGFYHRPTQIGELVDFVVQRVRTSWGGGGRWEEVGRRMRLVIENWYCGFVFPFQASRSISSNYQLPFSITNAFGHHLRHPRIAPARGLRCLPRG